MALRPQSGGRPLRPPWRCLALLPVILSIWLEGCDDAPQTCYPDSSASDTGEYSCVSNRYCSRQDFATVLPNAMSLQECMDECKSRNCQVIQYDCGTHCWLLDSCGDHVESGCQSSIYYRDLNFVASTTSTTTVSVELGSCFPNTVDSGQYSCTATHYCSNQANGVNTGTKTLQSCIDECDADSSCVSIQYDCSTDCVLFTGGHACGTELTTVCGSSLYYKQASAAVSTSDPNLLGSCFPNTVDSGQYSCTATHYCSNQANGVNTGTKTLQSCIDECNADSSCVSIQYDCSTDCVLFTGGQACGTEVTTVCGSSLYYKQAGAVSTTGPNVPGGCFPSTFDTGSYTCSAEKYCMNQASALQLGTMSLTQCMAECDSRSGCTSLQYDCGTDCWLMVTDVCGTELPTSCGSSVYYKAQSTQAATTTVPQGGLNCFPNAIENGLFHCQPESYCSNQADALQLGTMSLDACMRQCLLYDCGAVQYDCNTDCWLLRTCDSYVTTSCGSSVYLRDSQGWPAATTTTTTIFGECFPTTAMSYDFADFLCQPAVYCGNQAYAGMFGAMTIHQCAEMCRHNSTCQAIQYDCNSDCYLLDSCTTQITSVCGSSVYLKISSATSVPGGTYLLADGHTSITYSPSSCDYDDCLVTATCPSGSSPIECATIPPQSGDGAYQGTYSSGVIHGAVSSCEAKGQGSSKTVIAQAICSDLVDTHSEGISTMTTGDLWVECSDGSAVSCNCWTAWRVTEVCGEGRGTFAPTITAGNVPRCEQTIPTSGDGGGISAICAKGKYSASYLWSSNVITADDSVQYCGWSQDLYATTSSEIVEADCRAWMIEDDSSLGGCRSTECTRLSDCERICSRCGQCTGFLHSIVLGAQVTSGLFCTMVVAPSSSGINTILDQPPDVMMVGAVGAVFYVNTRHQQCSRMASISRVSLFSDKACTTLVKPTSVVDDLGQSLSGHWSYIHSYVPTCLPNCVLEDSFYKAAFAQSTGVLCAVLHSTEEFSKGWQIRLDANGGVEAASTFFPQLSSLLAESSYGTAVSFGTSPNLVEGKEVFFTGDLTITCSELVGYAGKCRGGDAGLWRLDIAAALAKMLAIEPHMVHVFNTRRLRQDRRLQTVQMLFSVTIRFFVDKPHQAALANSVAAQLEDMQQQYSSLFNQTLINLIAPFNDKNLDVTSLSTFTRSDFGPDFVELPTAAPSTTVVTAAATTTVGLQATPSPGVLTEEDDTGIILGIVFGTFGFMAIFFTVCILCRKKKKVTHPAPVVRGGVSSSGPEAVSVVGKAEVLHDSDEGMAPLSNDAYNSLPGYWNARKDLNPTFEMDFETANRSKKDDLRFDDLMYVSYKNMAHFQDLVSKTYQDIVTQDRLCPNGTHDKTRGGCPCVQVGGDPGLPSDFQVMRVIRVEESGMFNRYVAKREQIRQKRLETDGKTCEAPDPPFFTRDWMASNPDSELCELDDRVNEVYLWHGTQVRTGLQIAMNDFNLTFAGSGAGTMYGKGLYFTESSTKADEYARDEPDGHYDGIRALLLCRVCVGKFYYTQGREPTAIDKYTAGESDSTLGDRAKSVNTYREIVVYNEDQVYPEYLVIYERLHGGARSSPPREDLPFQLELPLYWKTVGKNPYKEGFRKHRVVKHEIVELFQRLADGTCKSSVKVLKVRRIEDSALWCRYINWKRNLSQGLLEEGDKIKAPNELDGNPDSGHVLTEKILAENRGDHAISVENMQPGLNEMLLWHGTSQQAAEAIAEEGFVVADARHGRRFGNGVYLAEDLTKSLDYCKSAANGVNYVLLCRATCGHIYYTEKDWDSGADSPAKAAGCTCVLANPSKKGPREYILFDQSQVYPEYIVEMTRG